MLSYCEISSVLTLSQFNRLVRVTQKCHHTTLSCEEIYIRRIYRWMQYPIHSHCSLNRISINKLNGSQHPPPTIIHLCHRRLLFNLILGATIHTFIYMLHFANVLYKNVYMGIVNHHLLCLCHFLTFLLVCIL